ncbi:hypothetical protein ACLX1H_005529 [Fusarium chlamydosporum]
MAPESTDDTNSVIASTIRDWLSTCLTCHTTCLNSQPSAVNNDDILTSAECWCPTWLIDVNDWCIVRGNVKADYFALSYTWGEDNECSNEKLQLLSHNVDSLTSTDSLNRHRHQLSKAIIDAIELTAAIGTRYLWVDRLCIIQDDPHKVAEFMDMDRIYSGATVTIIAAAQSGLYIEPTDSVRNFTVPSINMRGQAAHQIVRTYYQAVARSKWATRGWTYQEYILSSRVVFFLGTIVFWQCEGAVWDSNQLRLDGHEPAPPQEIVMSDPSGSTFMRHMETPAWPDFRLYADLICPYNGRELSHQEDGLSACLGILNRLEPAFPGGFVSGLPRLYLDHALLWQPLKCVYDSPDPPINPSRKHSDGCEESTGPSTRRPSLPSWAWSGWQCFVEPKSLLAGSDIQRQGTYENDVPRSWRLLRTVEWECTNDTSFPNDLEKQDKQCADRSLNLLPLPSRRSLSSLPKYIAAWTSCITLRHAATLEIRIEPFMRKRAAFMNSSVNPVLSEKPLNEMCKVAVLQDSTGRFAGLLRITDSAASVAQGDMTIVAMSQGSANGRDLRNCFEEKVFRRSRYHNPDPFQAIYDDNERWVDSSSELSYKGEENYRILAVGDHNTSLELSGAEYNDIQDYEFYNVLWVQGGKDGISYR